ncbi:5-oxoprolinase subunit B family protein [Agilicoccus flavus]|uniref:5-oxoprolinase subunit B family protein n=1 Tax=Agilicoccus flavus TaxID=2775968 RepID=UPI001CF69327|nr:allophanate hydrolase subunit 1 [Agilicoccus flavus]
MRVHRLGDVGILAEPGDLDRVLALDALVRARREAGDPGLVDVVDVVPAARTLMLSADAGADLSALAASVRALAAGPEPGAASDPERSGPGHDAGEPVRIEVRYDGDDLEDVARLAGLEPAQVVAAHTGTTWRAAFGGFAPGFFYLMPHEHGDPPGDGPTLPSLPRRDEPRTKVPAGAVGLAGEFSAVYPRASPGGWQLIGRTDAVMWDVDRDPPALLAPGALVRFVEVTS